MRYIFRTQATMKAYNRKNWWIDRDIVREFHVDAENLREALKAYQGHAEDCCVTVSDNALRTKSEMYVDAPDGSVKQVGYVLTGKTDFEKENRSGWSTQYIDLWVTIFTVIDTDFSEAA